MAFSPIILTKCPFLRMLREKGGVVLAKSLADVAYEEIKDMILKNRLRPGEKIGEQELSKRLNMSRTPIRAALKQLHHERLVINSPRTDTVVAPLSLKDFEDMIVVFMALEEVAVALSCLYRTEEEVSGVKGDLLRLRKEVLAGDLKDRLLFLDFDRSFHRSIWRMAKNPVLLNELDHLNQSYMRYGYFVDFDWAERSLLVVDEHLDILQAIEQRDAPKAKLLYRLHLEYIRTNTILYLKEYQNRK